MFNWPSINARLTSQSGRTGFENNWYALTGRVLAVKVEADGDLHIALQDATGEKPGIVVRESAIRRVGAGHGGYHRTC